MRMYMIDTRLMCKRHLLEEHANIHVLAGLLDNEKAIVRLAHSGAVELRSIVERHDVLAKEMLRRGLYHRSPLRDAPIDHLPPSVRASEADTNAGKLHLISTCPACAKRLVPEVLS